MNNLATYHSPIAEKVGYLNPYGKILPGTLLLNRFHLTLEVQRKQSRFMRWLTGKEHRRFKLIFSFHLSNIASIERGIYHTYDVLELCDKQGHVYSILVRNYRDWEQALTIR